MAEGQSCGSCASEMLRKFTGEVAIHVPGLANIDVPVVFVFPELVACLNCGVVQFTVTDHELRLLAEREAARR
jgi:hypothetical protein